MEVKAHPWFDDYPWDKLQNKQIEAPFVPDQVDNFDVKVTNDAWKDEETDKMKESAILLRRETVQDLFKGYYYDQSFEGFNFNVEEKVNPIVTANPNPNTNTNAKRTAYKSCQLSPKRTGMEGASHCSSKSTITSSKGVKVFKHKRESQQVMQRYRPMTRPVSNGKTQSRNMVGTRVPPRKVVLPKGPFHYRNESKKISQI
jgi:hypothetical protein